MKLVYQYMAIFFNFPPTSSHLHPLQAENCDSNSRLVVDVDDNGKFRPERAKCEHSIEIELFLNEKSITFLYCIFFKARDVLANVWQNETMTVRDSHENKTWQPLYIVSINIYCLYIIMYHKYTSVVLEIQELSFKFSDYFSPLIIYYTENWQRTLSIYGLLGRSHTSWYYIYCIWEIQRHWIKRGGRAL